MLGWPPEKAILWEDWLSRHPSAEEMLTRICRGLGMAGNTDWIGDWSGIRYVDAMKLQQQNRLAGLREMARQAMKARQGAEG